MSVDRLKQNPVAVCLMGPTASGKTALAMKLCDALPCEIISVDSAQVYRGLNIGVAKPNAEELARYPHQLIDIREPEEPYSVAEFQRDGLREMDKIVKKGRIPLFVGGSMLYFRALTQGTITDLPPANDNVRRNINRVAYEKGWPEVHAMLSKVDPETAERLHVNDSQRLQRALEVYLSTGKTLTDFHKEQERRYLFPYRCVNIAITPKDRAVLHERIAHRCHQMFEAGFVDEVKQLRARRTLHLGLPSMRSVGYRQVWEFLENSETNRDMENLVERCIIATRQLAKRQLTWLRSWRNVNWFDSISSTLLVDTISILNCFYLSKQ